jgi:hypothetical protein
MRIFGCRAHHLHMLLTIGGGRRDLIDTDRQREGMTGFGNSTEDFGQ